MDRNENWQLIIEETWRPPHMVELDGETVHFCQVTMTSRTGNWVCGRVIVNPADTACAKHAAEGLSE